MRALLAVFAVALLLTACSAGDGQKTPDPSPVSKQVDASNGTTVRQWASVIAEEQARFDEWNAKWEADQCSVADSTICGIETLSGSFVSETISIKLKTPMTKTALKGYLAPAPPAEIRSLYAETRASADDFNSAMKAWSGTCNASTGGAECHTLLFKVGSTAGTLQTKFAAWAPYL